MLCGGMAALHTRFWISGGGLPFETSAALSASDDLTKTEALKSVRGLPVSEASPNFVDYFIQKSRGFNLDNLGRSGVTKFEAITGLDAFSDLAALSASEDFTKADALKVFRCPDPEQFHGAEAVDATASNRRSSLRNSGANERWIPRRNPGVFNIDNSADRVSQSLRPSQDSMPSQTWLFSRLLTVSQMSMLSKRSGAPIRNSFMDPRLLLLLLQIGAPHRERRQREVDSTTTRGVQHWTPFRHLYLSFELLALCQRPWRKRVFEFSDVTRIADSTLAQRVTSTALRIRSTRFIRTTR